jgi:hypothetical protein
MTLLISDRDGVLFDTCIANVFSYTAAAKKMNLRTNLEFLELSVHEGKGFFEFYREVWGDLTEVEIHTLKSVKDSIFMAQHELIKVNVDFVENIVKVQKDPYLVTRASLSSTNFLLKEFRIDFFGDRVLSVKSPESKSKLFTKIATENNLHHSSITVVDDSNEIVLESRSLGFHAIHYPHFCN